MTESRLTCPSQKRFPKQKTEALRVSCFSWNWKVAPVGLA